MIRSYKEAGTRSVPFISGMLGHGQGRNMCIATAALGTICRTPRRLMMPWYLVRICSTVFICFARSTSPMTLNSKASVKVLQVAPEWHQALSASVTYFSLSMSSHSLQTARTRRDCWASRLQVVVHLGDVGGSLPVPSGWIQPSSSNVF